MDYLEEIFSQSNKTKYAKWYISICKKGQSIRDIEYFEKHHIIPKFMNGSNSRKNITRLTGREHFIVHLLLTKMIDSTNLKIRSKAALGAFMSQNRNGNRKLNSRQIEIARQAKSESQKNKKFTDEHKSRISAALTGKRKSTEHIENNRLSHMGNKLSSSSIELREKTKKENRTRLMIEQPNLYEERRIFKASKRSKGSVWINGIFYVSIHEAAKKIERNPDYITRRIFSNDFPDWVFVPNLK